MAKFILLQKYFSIMYHVLEFKEGKGKSFILFLLKHLALDLLNFNKGKDKVCVIKRQNTLEYISSELRHFLYSIPGCYTQNAGQLINGLFKCFTIVSRFPFRNEHNCLINKNHNLCKRRRSKVVATIPLPIHVCRRKHFLYYLAWTVWVLLLISLPYVH